MPEEYLEQQEELSGSVGNNQTLGRRDHELA